MYNSGEYQKRRRQVSNRLKRAKRSLKMAESELGSGEAGHCESQLDWMRRRVERDTAIIAALDHAKTIGDESWRGIKTLSIPHPFAPALPRGKRPKARHKPARRASK